MMCSVSSSGITIRNCSTQSLQCDLPAMAICKIEHPAQSHVLKVSCRPQLDIALFFPDAVFANTVMEVILADEILKSRCVQNPLGTIMEEDHSPEHEAMDNRHDHSLPDLSDPNVQELIVRLANSDAFQVFVENLSSFFDELTTAMPIHHTPNSDTTAQQQPNSNEASPRVNYFGIEGHQL